jgi:diadenosine tetraphosphate (Ap4A) HIT family hydrolase
MKECYSCVSDEEPAMVYEHFRVVHAFNSTLPGWMVIVSRRHVTSFGEFNSEESIALGALMTAVPRAVEKIVHAPKAYVAFFAEAPGFDHVHVHVIPRMSDLAVELRGTNVFELLHRPAEDQVGPQEQASLVAHLGELLMVEPGLENHPGCYRPPVTRSNPKPSTL